MVRGLPFGLNRDIPSVQDGDPSDHACGVGNGKRGCCETRQDPGNTHLYILPSLDIKRAALGWPLLKN